MPIILFIIDIITISFSQLSNLIILNSFSSITGFVICCLLFVKAALQYSSSYVNIEAQKYI